MFNYKTVILCLFVTKCVLAAPSTLLPEVVENIETNTEHINLPEIAPTIILETSTDGEVVENEMQYPESVAVQYIPTVEEKSSSEESEEDSKESEEQEEVEHGRFARHIGYGVGVIGIGGGGFGGYGYRPYYPRSYGGYGYGYGYGRPWGYSSHYRSPYGF